MNHSRELIQALYHTRVNKRSNKINEWKCHTGNHKVNNYSLYHNNQYSAIVFLCTVIVGNERKYNQYSLLVVLNDMRLS